jgi:hypothetical protein
MKTRPAHPCICAAGTFAPPAHGHSSAHNSARRSSFSVFAFPLREQICGGVQSISHLSAGSVEYYTTYSQRWNFSMQTLFRVRPYGACTNDDRRNLHAITRGVITKFITQNQQRNLCSLSDDATRLVYAPLTQIFMIAPSPPETLITRCLCRCIHLLRFPPRGTQIKCEKSVVFVFCLISLMDSN